MPFSSSSSKPCVEAERLAQRDQRLPGGIARGLQRQRVGAGDVAADRGDAHFRLVDAAHHRDVAHAVDGMAEQVEADADVADAAGREGAAMRAAGRLVRSRSMSTLMRAPAHARLACSDAGPMREPSDCAIASTSPNTPAAVTSGPAPGPCTTSGLSA